MGWVDCFPTIAALQPWGKKKVNFGPSYKFDALKFESYEAKSCTWVGWLRVGWGTEHLEVLITPEDGDEIICMIEMLRKERRSWCLGSELEWKGFLMVLLRRLAWISPQATPKRSHQSFHPSDSPTLVLGTVKIKIEIQIHIQIQF